MRTKMAYSGWIRRYILFHGKRHSAGMGKPEAEALLTRLAVARNASMATRIGYGGAGVHRRATE